MTTNFPTRARRDDPNGHMVVQQNLEFLRDAFDTLAGKFKQGSATINTGATQVVVTHGLGAAQYQVVITPVNGDPGSRYWVDSKTSTQFTIKMQTTPGVNSIYDWIVKGA